MTAMLLLLAGCAHGSGNAADYWCRTNYPRFFTQSEWDAKSRKEQNRELSYNEYGVQICGKAWAQKE